VGWRRGFPSPSVDHERRGDLDPAARTRELCTAVPPPHRLSGLHLKVHSYLRVNGSVAYRLR